jgi:hypothetical protein
VKEDRILLVFRFSLRIDIALAVQILVLEDPGYLPRPLLHSSPGSTLLVQRFRNLVQCPLLTSPCEHLLDNLGLAFVDDKLVTSRDVAELRRASW